MENIQRSLFYVTLVIALIINAVDTIPKSANKSTLDLIILHNNDMHSRFDQTCISKDRIANKCYGGFARVSHVLKDYRHQAENGGPSVLYLNAGDTYEGTPWFTIFEDKIVSRFLNILKPDAMSLGNHELNLGVGGLIPFLNNITFPVVISNLNNSHDHPIYQSRSLNDSIVLDVNGFKVGIVGYLTPKTKQISTPIDLEFAPEVGAVNQEALKLKDANVNIIIALGHSGYEMDKEIAKKCPLVDVVIGGHTHSFLYSGKQPDEETIVGPYPTVIVQDNGKQVPVVTAYAFTKYLGKLELSFDEDGHLVKWGGQPILLNESIPSDPEVLKLLEEYRPAVIELTETTIGKTKVYLEGWKCRAIECNLGNLISDSMVFARAKEFVGRGWTDAPIAFVNSGDIRASIQAGNITKYDLKTAFPYDNGLYVMNVTGNLLKRILEHSVELYAGNRGEFLQMSGIRVVFNVTRSANDRITSLEILCSDCAVPKYEKYYMNRIYGIIISSFLYDGHDGFDMIKEIRGVKLNYQQFDVIQKYIETMDIVYPMLEGRITIHGKKIYD